MTKLYIIGSLRNAAVTETSAKLRALGYEVFDDWHAAGPNCDDEWQRYEKERGRSYKEGLDGAFANNGFNFDKKHLDECDAAVLVMPGGKSAHLELGYITGKGKPGFILFDAEPERWDLMYKFATGIAFGFDELECMLERVKW